MFNLSIAYNIGSHWTDILQMLHYLSEALGMYYQAEALQYLQFLTHTSSFFAFKLIYGNIKLTHPYLQSEQETASWVNVY